MTHPKDWKSVKFANVGTDEAFVREMLELITILEGSLIGGAQRERAKSAIMTIMNDGLIPACLELRTIRAPETASLPMAERLQLYEDFARKLWKANKDLTQRAAKEMRFDIGFLYQNDKEFEICTTSPIGRNSSLNIAGPWTGSSSGSDSTRQRETRERTTSWNISGFGRVRRRPFIN